MYEETVSSFAVKVEVVDDEQNKVSVKISGPQTLSYCKPEDLLKVKDKDELLNVLLKKIVFEEIDGALDEELTDYSLGEVLAYLKQKEEVNDDPFMSSLQRIRSNFEKFEEELAEEGKICSISIHQYHSAGNEEADFADYLNIPYMEEAEEVREYLESGLTDSDIEAVMECFEDGEFYVSSYECEEVLSVDLHKQEVKKIVKVNTIEPAL